MHPSSPPWWSNWSSQRRSLCGWLASGWDQKQRGSSPSLSPFQPHDKEAEGGGGFLLLTPNKWACRLLGWMVVLRIVFSLRGNFEGRLGANAPPTACMQQPTSSPSPSACLHPSMKEVMERIRKETGKLKGADQKINGHKNLHWREKACNRRAISVDSRPPQNVWRVSRVTKSFHFLCSMGIAQTCLRKLSCSTLICGWTWAENEKETR